MFDKHSQKRIWVRVLILICCSIGGHGMSHAAGIKEKPYDLSGLPKELANKIDDQRRELVKFKIALLAYAAKHNALPRRISDAIGPETGMELPPRDYFRDQMTATYFVQSSMYEAMFYSYGPDGKDDKGAELGKPAKDGVPPAGDIADRISLADLEKARQEEKKQSEGIYKKLVDVRVKTGRDNAIIHYIEATWKMDLPPANSLWHDYESGLIIKNITHGWQGGVNPTTGILARYEPAIAEARKGIALEEAVNVASEENPSQNLNDALQTLAKMLCLEGRRFESMRKPSSAMNEYLAVLTMGRDLGKPETALAGAIMSTGIQQMGIDRILWLASNVALDAKTLERAAARLKTIEFTQSRFIDIIVADQKNSQVPIDSDLRRVNEAEKARFSVPIWEREAKGFGMGEVSKLAAQMPGPLKKILTHDADAEKRILCFRASLSQARIAIAIELYRRKYRVYPASLAQLVPALLDAAPIDPFTGRAMSYRASGASYMLWSIGPDMRSNAAMISYDPTNGTESVGDIVQAR